MYIVFIILKLIIKNQFICWDSYLSKNSLQNLHPYNLPKNKKNKLLQNQTPLLVYNLFYKST